MEKRDFLDKELTEVIKEKYDSMFAAEKKILDFVLENPQRAVNCNVSELAKMSKASAATVVRTCQDLGYSGYHQFRIRLASDLGKRQTQDEKLLGGVDEKDAVVTLFRRYAETMLAIGRNNDAETMGHCVDLIKNCRYAHIMAIGNTAPLAQYMGFRLGRLGVKCTYNVAADYFMNHVNLAEKDDILIAISQSGVAKQVIQGLEFGKSKGLKSIAITASAHSPLAELADYTLISAGTEEAFNYYKVYAHLNETAVIDALLSFVTNEELIKTSELDKLEMMLSEQKL